MKIIKKINQLNKYISNVSNVGFVPTMGGLHKGHISLIKKSKNISGKTLDSIFVNTTQFEKKKDFDRTIFSTYGNLIFLILILLYIFLTISFNRIRNE